MSLCFIIVYSLAAIVILYGLFEFHYFLRMCLCVFLARCVKQKTHILDTTTISGICLTTDIDTLLYHMNNARYLRELDFARVDFYERSNLYRTIVAKGGSVFQGAATIRYRRFIRPFSRFTITSRIIYWDDQSVFMEHRFISPVNNFIHSIAICRQRIINCSAEDVMNELLFSKNQFQHTQLPRKMSNSTINIQNDPSGAAVATSAIAADQVENGHVRLKLKPEIPLEISKWIEYNEISSKNLRSGC